MCQALPMPKEDNGEHFEQSPCPPETFQLPSLERQLNKYIIHWVAICYLRKIQRINSYAVLERVVRKASLMR